MNRHCLSMRRRTTVSQRLPRDILSKVTMFIMGIRRLRHSNKYPLGSIGNMDETPLWMDMPGETTICSTGERSVPIRSTGHDKNRFTVCLSAMTDGRKLKPFIVFKGVRAIPELQSVSGVVVAMSRNGWMNEDLTKDWVKRCWGTLSFRKRLLVWDAYKCHITDGVKSVVKRSTNSDLSIVPGGLTGHVQPADVSWNKPFKARYKELYQEWMVNGEKTYTRGGNVRAPSKLQCAEWVKIAWDAVSIDVVKNSFVYCGISVSVDGSEDSLIHCTKANGVAADALPEITTETTKLLIPDSPESDDEDPFKDIEEDEQELEENEAVIDDGEDTGDED